MAMREWVKLPNGWIEAGGLKEFRWGGSALGANNIAALMALAVIAHHADPDTGTAILTYDRLCTCTGLSRAKLSGGLSVLEKHGIIDRSKGRSVYNLAKYNPVLGWCKLPARALYSSNHVTAFSEFKLRQKAELNALKLYFLFASRRNRDSNIANLTYDTITKYTGIDRSHIKQALSFLTVNGMVHVETIPSQAVNFGISNGYRIAHLHPYQHMATIGRSMTAADFETAI